LVIVVLLFRNQMVRARLDSPLALMTGSTSHGAVNPR